MENQEKKQEQLVTIQFSFIGHNKTATTTPTTTTLYTTHIYTTQLLHPEEFVHAPEDTAALAAEEPLHTQDALITRLIKSLLSRSQPLV